MSFEKKMWQHMWHHIVLFCLVTGIASIITFTLLFSDVFLTVWFSPGHFTCISVDYFGEGIYEFYWLLIVSIPAVLFCVMVLLGEVKYVIEKIKKKRKK